jgi:hypothetical protein
VEKCQFDTGLLSSKMPDIRTEISSFSHKTEEILLLLVKENEDLKAALKAEKVDI